MHPDTKMLIGTAAVVGVFTMGLGGLVVGPLIAGVGCLIASNSAAKEKAARQRDIERRTRYHIHYRGD